VEKDDILVRLSVIYSVLAIQRGISCVYTDRMLIYISYRPKEFVKKSTYVEDSDEEESTVGKMPPADSDED
jgi:hypothetical protein